MKRCDGITRREFLHVGALSALGLGVADAMRLRASAAEGGALPNCILIWLDGGPSHLDTFDLKPDAPADVRGPFKPIATKVPGIQICEHFPRLAQQTDKLCIIRSMTSELGEHNFGSHYLLTGAKPSPVLEYPSFGSVVAHCRSGKQVLPSYIAVPNASPQGGNGYLPGSCRPFAVGGDPARPDFRVRDLEAPAAMPGARLERRRDFLSAVDQLSRQIEDGPARAERDAHFEQAYRLIFSPATKKAFDLTQEQPELRNRFGMQRLGQSCLLARRLVEAGCPFVTVTDATWDTHTLIERNLKEGFVGGTNGRIPQLDQALATLLADLDDRGLLQTTLVIAMGEFGRTPKLNSNAGRDHWPRAFSVLLAGAGVKAGLVVGKSDSRGESPADRPVSPTDLARTIYSLLRIDPDRELHTADGRPVQVVSGGKVIRECLA
ncbi:hypothetical protein AYO44_14340 [Planctomycetaceae bacterium SCGC AG-212-F19]|nr:hypothetical protein AYO44_14340 [Planctomycetaceae bacterium SCGC AG-212-F19]